MLTNKDTNDDHFGYFHVYNRGVDKRDIFIDDYDRIRAIESLRDYRKSPEGCGVEILAYCLMDNHYHLLVEQTKERGMAKFMHKFGTSYTNYFNKKHKRSGSLFEGRYKRKLLESDRHLFHLFRYIHMNPLKFFDLNWKNGLSDVEKAIQYIKDYPWSNFSFLFDTDQDFINHDLIHSEFRDLTDYTGFLSDWIRFGVPTSFSIK